MEGGNENAPRQGRSERGQGGLRKSVAILANLEFRSTGKSVKDMVTIFEGETTPSTTTNRGTRAASNASGSSQPGHSPPSSANLPESPLARLSANHPPKATTTGGQHPPANRPSPIVVTNPDDRKTKEPPAPHDPEGPAYELTLLMKQLDQFTVTSGGTTYRPSPPRQKPAPAQQRRDPKEVNNFWNSVRSQLHISDDELDDPPFIAETKRINALLDAADRADAEEEAKEKAAAAAARRAVLAPVKHRRDDSYSPTYSQETVRQAAATPPFQKEDNHPLSLARYRHLYDDTVAPPARHAPSARQASPLGPPAFPPPSYPPPPPPTRALPTSPKSPEEKLSELDEYFQGLRGGK